MFKRLRWVSMGAAAGAAASIWSQRKMRQTLDQHPQLQAGREAATKARRLGRVLSTALKDGREAMRDRETELRATISPPSRGSSPLRAVPDRFGAPGQGSNP